MLILPKPDLLPSEITDQSVYQHRRHFIKQAGFGVATALLSQPLWSATLVGGATEGDARLIGRANAPAKSSVTSGKKISPYSKTSYGLDEKLTPFKDVTTYNNYYEFGTDKSEPAVLSRLYKTDPWQISIEGEVKKNKVISIDEIFKKFPLEERIYRMRCVEGWSMVIPWVGFSLANLIKWAEPTGNAKYVEFISDSNKQTMPGTNLPILDWPYTEGLRMDEAMHPLTILAVGLYGEVLPNQNGAPIRLVVPWKYGFKGGKSIVKIRFTEKMPQTTWMKANSSEYGFYANVNPEVDHPRWTQSSEKRIGNGLFAGRIKTKMFNGYANQVGQMYTGMDLAKYF